MWWSAIAFQRLRFETVAIMFSINMAFNHAGPAHNKSLIPAIRDVWVDSIEGWGVASGLLNCPPEAPCTNFTLSNIATRYCQDQMCSNIHGTAHNVTTTLGQGPCAAFKPALLDARGDVVPPFVPFDLP